MTSLKKPRSKSAVVLPVPKIKKQDVNDGKPIEQMLKEQYDEIEISCRAPKTSEELYGCCPTGFSLENASKNRYKNVLPLEETRVRLKTSPQSDYINANHITSPTSSLEFITCQAPIPSTFEDFWRMIWEQRTGVIVMLTKLQEGFKRKADKYWPSMNRSERFGSFSVTCRNSYNLNLIKVRVFILSHMGEDREIVQLHYKEWPDFGVPDKSLKMKELIKKIYLHLSQASSKNLNGPAVIHCSAGLGRSGTLIAIIFAYEKLQRKTPFESINFRDILFNLRKQRPGMIQSFDQFLFLYRVVRDLNNEMRNPMERTISFQEREKLSTSGAEEVNCFA